MLLLASDKLFQEGRFDIVGEELFRQIDDAAGVLNALHRLDSRELIEEPAAARVHEHGVTLHFEELERGDAIRGGQLAGGMGAEEAVDILRRAVENHVDVLVARGPRIAKSGRPFSSKRDATVSRSQSSAWRSGRAPFLIPAGVPAGVAAAIAAPALDAVDATPRAVFKNLHAMNRRMALHVFGVVGDFGEVARFDGVEGEGQRHFAHFVMVAEGLAVGGDVDQFGPGPHVLGETGHEALDELLRRWPADSRRRWPGKWGRRRRTG